MAVTVTSRDPLKSAGGVPVKRLPSKDSHSGSASPFEMVALSVKASPSTSVKASTGRTKSISASSSKF